MFFMRDPVLRVNASDTLLGKMRPVNFLWHFGLSPD